jgi:hypothetical protein
MADSSWNTSSPAKGRRRGFPIWIAVPLAVMAGIAILVFALVGRATGLRRQAWPLIQAVHKRIATDEGARELFRANPACAEGYESEEAFLQAAREWRPKVGPLPAAEPGEDREGYRVNSDPFELTVAVRGEGGGWLRARFVTGPAAAGRNVGEGLTQLVFAASARDITDSARQARRHARAREWGEFRTLLLKLGTDESALALFRSETVLRQSWISEEAFLQDARSWRPFLAAIPEDLPAVEKDDTNRAEFHRNQSPLGSSREIRFTHPGGAWKVLWRDGALASISHRAR